MTVYGRTVLIDGRQVRVAERWRRFCARAIDSVIAAVGLGVAVTISALYIFGDYFVILGPAEPVPPAVGVLFWIVSLAILGHEVVLLALFGRTAGKALLGLRVVLLEDGTRPEPAHAFVRWALPAAAGGSVGRSATICWQRVSVVYWWRCRSRGVLCNCHVCGAVTAGVGQIGLPEP